MRFKTTLVIHPCEGKKSHCCSVVMMYKGKIAAWDRSAMDFFFPP